MLTNSNDYCSKSKYSLIFFPDFQVDEIEGITVSMDGLGPLYWFVRRVLLSLLRRHLRDFLQKEGKSVIEQELQVSIATL